MRTYWQRRGLLFSIVARNNIWWFYKWCGYWVSKSVRKGKQSNIKIILKSLNHPWLWLSNPLPLYILIQCTVTYMLDFREQWHFSSFSDFRVRLRHRHKVTLVEVNIIIEQIFENIGCVVTMNFLTHSP